MKENYKAWNLNIADFYSLNSEKDRLHFILKFAVLAPSAHNIQPWKFSIRDNRIEVYLHEDRRLRESDKDEREVYISLGCAIENISVAAKYYGYGTEISYIFRGDLVAEISLTRVGEEKTDDLINYIARRVTNRGKYQNKLPDHRFISYLDNLNSLDIRINMVKEQELKHQLADLALEAMVYAMSDEDFRKELSDLVKHNLTKSKVGMPAFGMGIPTPVSFMVPFLMKRMNMQKLSLKNDLQIFKEFTPLYIIISSQNDDKSSWVKIGQIFQEMSLVATRSGISVAPWQAPIEMKEFRQRLKEILKINFLPQFFIRAGYAIKSTPHAPRLEAADVMQK